MLSSDPSTLNNTDLCYTVTVLNQLAELVYILLSSQRFLFLIMLYAYYNHFFEMYHIIIIKSECLKITFLCFTLQCNIF